MKEHEIFTVPSQPAPQNKILKDRGWQHSSSHLTKNVKGYNKINIPESTNLLFCIHKHSLITPIRKFTPYLFFKFIFFSHKAPHTTTLAKRFESLSENISNKTLNIFETENGRWEGSRIIWASARKCQEVSTSPVLFPLSARWEQW